MKELQGTAANISLLEGSNNNLIGMAEIVIILSEPQYQPDGSGGLARIRTNEQVRFAAGVKQIRSMIDSLTEFADDIEELQKRASLAEKEQP